MNNIIKNSLLLVFSLVFVLFAAELTVSIAKPQNLSGSWRVATTSGLLANKSSGSARHQFGNRTVNYSFASPHLRGPLPSGSVRVLVLGDSYTYGWLLDDQKNYVSLLQQKIDSKFGLETFALLNAATGGWGTGDYVAYAEEFGEEIRPDIILVFINSDDIGRAMRSPLWTFDAASGALTRKVAQVSKFKEMLNATPGYQWLLENSHLIQLSRTLFLNSRFAPPLAHGSGEATKFESVVAGPRSSSDAETALIAKSLGAALFSRLHSWSEKNDVYLIVTTTGWHQPPYKLLSGLTEAFMTGADELFAEFGVPFFDPSAQLLRRKKSANNTFIIPNELHPNEAGAALVAEYVYPFLSSQLERFCHLTNRCAGGVGPSP
jgi:lysophospholipase L1-like esterase